MDGHSMLYFRSERLSRVPGSNAKLHVFLEGGFHVSDGGEARNTPGPVLAGLGVGGGAGAPRALHVLQVADPSTGSVLRLGAPTAKERDEWVAALRAACGGEPAQLPVLSAKELEARLPELVDRVRCRCRQDRWLMARDEVLRIEAPLRAGAGAGSAGPGALRWRERLRPHDQLFSEAKAQAAWAEDALAQFQSNAGWELVSDKPGEKISFKEVEGMTFGSLKIDSILQCSPVQLAAVIAEADLAHAWLPFCNRASLLAKPSHMHGFAHLFFELPVFVPLDNRDIVLEGRGVDLMERRSVLIMIRSIDEGTPEAVNAAAHCAIPPVSRGFTRAEADGGFLITMLSPSTVRFRIIVNVDLHAPMLSPAVINSVNKMFAGMLVQLLKKQVDKFDRTEFAERVRGNRDFYGDLEKRVAAAQGELGASAADGGGGDDGGGRGLQGGAAGTGHGQGGEGGVGGVLQRAAPPAFAAAAVAAAACYSGAALRARQLALQSVSACGLVALLWGLFVAGVLLGVSRRSIRCR
eukprot:g4818.t1